MAVAAQDRKRASPRYKTWIDDVAAYESSFQTWEVRVEKILKRYRDKRTQTANQTAKFNILWSNVQTLVPATYSRVPKPDVARRYRDNDPVGRVASLLLERALEFEISHYPTYRTAMKACVMDRFLGGRGTSWVRYEPHTGPLEDGAQVTDDVEAEDAAEPAEAIDYECTPVDYVHWRDFGHSVARTWEEVTRVWRKVYMARPALVERFGKELGNAIPLDEIPEDLKKQDKWKGVKELACIYEGWDKENRTAVWFNKSIKDFLDERAINEEPDSPPDVEGFFPCPPPLYATLTNESLEPIPDFSLYQDQANELDILADRIDGLIKALKVTGVYDASQGVALARLFTEGANNTLIPVNNWQSFAEKNGLKGTIDVVDLDPIARALKESYTAFAQVIQFIYQITGIADIVRGVSDPNETLGAQEIKKNFVGLRLGDMKAGVAQFATDILRLMAEIICTKYQPQTILQMAAAQQLAQEDQQYIMPALEMLKNEPLRNFRIDIAADTLVQMDEQQEKENRVEFLGAVSGFLAKTTEALAMVQPAVAAVLGPLCMDLLKWGVTGFRAGKTIEGAIDAAADKLKALAAQPPPPPQPDPKLEAEKFKAQAEQERAKLGLQTEQQKAQLDIGVAQQHAQIEHQGMQMEQQHDMAKLAIDGERMKMELAQARAMPKKPAGNGPH